MARQARVVVTTPTMTTMRRSTVILLKILIAIANTKNRRPGTVRYNTVMLISEEERQ